MLEQHVDIQYAKTAKNARGLRNRGFEPVECAFGKESVVGPLVLDHHGQYFKEEAVSIKALRLAQNGVFKDRFVATGTPDCDLCYAIAALSNQIPLRIEDAEAVAEIDTDPIGRNKTSERYLPVLLFEQNTHGFPNSAEGTYRALEELVRIFNKKYTPEDEEVQKAISYEAERKRKAKLEIKIYTEGKVAFVESCAMNFDVWYGYAPVVVKYDPDKKKITVGLCPKKGGTLGDKTGFDILGPGGLTPLCGLLDRELGKTGWGGRNVIIGSPRNVKMWYKKAFRVYGIIEGFVDGKVKG